MTRPALISAELPEAAHIHLARLRRVWAQEDLRWVSPEWVSFWLAAFELPQPLAWEGADLALRRVAREHSTVTVRFGEARWIEAGDGVTLEVALLADADRLAALLNEVRSALEQLGFNVQERRPAVVLARASAVPVAPGTSATPPRCDPFELGVLELYAASDGAPLGRRARHELRSGAAAAGRAAHDAADHERRAIAEALDLRLRNIPLPRARAAEAPRLAPRRRLADPDDDLPEDTQDEASSDGPEPSTN
jgi:hypothetical protein